MVSILPSERTPWDVISKAIGQNLQQNLPSAFQKGYERQLGLNAIDQMEKDIAAQQNTGKPVDPMKLLTSIIRAGAQNENIERALGPLYQTALTQSQRKTGAEEFPAGQGRVPTKKESDTGQEVPVSVEDIVPKRPSFVQDPTGVSNFQLPYGPDEIANIRQQARQRGYTPEAEERYVADALEYNKIAQMKRDADISNYQQQQQQRKDTLENQALFEEYLTKHSPEFAENPDELEIALKESQKYQNEPSFSERNAQVKKALRPYQQAKSALNKALQRPLFGQTKEQRDLARPRAKMMIEMGQKPQLQLMIAKNGHGEVEEADLLNPLPEEFEKKLNGFRKFINPAESTTQAEPFTKEYEEEKALNQKRYENQKFYMTDFLSREIVPGTYEQPGTNLLLTRAHLMQKGLNYLDAGKIIDDAIEKGKIKLDPQQKIDYQKLAMPPLTGDTYLDTIMNNLMFPITGKQ